MQPLALAKGCSRQMDIVIAHPMQLLHDQSHVRYIRFCVVARMAVVDGFAESRSSQAKGRNALQVAQSRIQLSLRNRIQHGREITFILLPTLCNVI